MADPEDKDRPLGTNPATQRMGPAGSLGDLVQELTFIHDQVRDRVNQIGRSPAPSRHSVPVRPRVPTDRPAPTDQSSGDVVERETIPTEGLIISQEPDDSEAADLPRQGGPLPAAGRSEQPTQRASSPQRAPRPRPAQRPVLPTEVGPKDTRAASPDPSSESTARVDRLVVEPSAFSAAPWWSSDLHRLADMVDLRDLRCDAGTAGSVAAVAVTLRGDKHRYLGAPNDDAVAIRLATDPDGGRWVIGCVCDGVGSASHSTLGSASVVGSVAEELARLVRDGGWADPTAREGGVAATVETARRNAQELAQALGVDVRDLETTLTLSVVSADAAPDAPRPATVAWVGDSPALLLAAGTWRGVDPNPEEEAEDGLTSSRTNGLLTTARLDGFVEFGLSPDEVLMLCTDGIGGFVGLGDNRRVVGEALAAHLSEPTDVLRVVNLLSFEFRTADDDRSAVILWPLDRAVS